MRGTSPQEMSSISAWRKIEPDEASYHNNPSALGARRQSPSAHDEDYRAQGLASWLGTSFWSHYGRSLHRFDRYRHPCSTEIRSIIANDFQEKIKNPAASDGEFTQRDWGVFSKCGKFALWLGVGLRLMPSVPPQFTYNLKSRLDFDPDREYKSTRFSPRPLSASPAQVQWKLLAFATLQPLASRRSW